MFRVTATDRQIADLMENERSFLWPHLHKKAMEEMGLEHDSLPGIFGRINLKGLREGLFVGGFKEIDLTDIPDVPSEVPAFVPSWKRFLAAAVTLASRLKRAPPSTNDA